MGAEPRRSGLAVGLLIGLTTAAAVSIPVFRCTQCRKAPRNHGEPPARWGRINGRFVVSDRRCGACAGRMKLTGLSRLIGAVQGERRR